MFFCFVEEQLHADGVAPHDPEGVPDVGLEVEVQGELEGVVGRGAAPAPLHGKERDGFPQVAVGYEVEAPIRVPSR